MCKSYTFVLNGRSVLVTVDSAVFLSIMMQGGICSCCEDAGTENEFTEEDEVLFL